MQQAGDLDESFRALVEFCDLAPDEVDVRLAVADQMASTHRTRDAVEQLSVAYRALMASGDPRSSGIEAQILRLDPHADLTAAAPSTGSGMFVRGSAVSVDGEIVAAFGEIEIGGAVAGSQEQVEEAAEEEAPAFELPTFGLEEEEAEEEAPAFELPTFGFEEEVAEEEAPVLELPTFGLEEEEAEEEAPPLPVFAFEDEEPASAAPSEPPAPPVAPKVAEPTFASLSEEISKHPDDVDLHQRRVEVAYQSSDERYLVEAFLGLGQALQRGGFAARAKAAFQQVLQVEPDNEADKAALGQAVPVTKPVREVAAHQDYVDLGAMILGGEDEKTTRFVVAYEEPTGDDAADFAKMLSQFKEKVAQNLDADDVRAHYDLGTA